MSINFDGHHSGGSSFDYVIRCGPYPQVPVWFKKKNQVESQYLVSRPENRFGSTNQVGPGFGA